jgi:hypothetical protein
MQFPTIFTIVRSKVIQRRVDERENFSLLAAPLMIMGVTLHGIDRKNI